jgi:aspartate aminotransferase-like enzyme
MAKKLFIPGPVEVHKDILAAMSVPMMGHRSSDYAALHKRVTEKLKRLLYTEGRVFLSTSSAFGVMEGAVKNLVQKRCANFCNGAFSAKWNDVTLRCGLEADAFSAEWGSPITPEMVDEALKTGKYDTMTLVHNETSTGVMSPLEEIAEVMKKYPGVSFIVDTVSSMSGVKVEVDKLGLDVCVASVQKAFGLPPGLAVFTVSDRALEKAKSTPNRGYYFDFLEFAANDEKHNTPSTPCISLIHALDVQLDRIFKEGAEERFARHSQMAEKTQKWILSQGFELFASDGYRSQTLTSGKNSKNADLEGLKKKLSERGFVFDIGYGKIKNKAFRIAHMADIMLEDLDELFQTIEDIWAGK